jgi:predicted nucleotidyltransferase
VNFFASLSAAARDSNLRFLVIGGHAINASGYARVTADLDLLVCKDDRSAWTELVDRLGYTIFHDGQTFLQLSPPASLAAWPLDLMFVAQPTFDAMWQAASRVEMDGSAMPIPALLHLIALKLHALKTGDADRQGRDFQDVVGLIRVGGVDIGAPEIRELFEKYGTIDWYERTVSAVRGDRQ